MAFRLIALLVLAVVMATAPAKAASDLPRDFDRRVEDLMSRAGVPGLSLAVIREGKTVKVAQYGYANAAAKEALTSDHVFQAASLSKPVMAYIVMRLVDQGVLALDTPLYELLENNRFDNEVYAEALTARLTLSHQPGLPNWGKTPLKFMFAPGLRFSYSGEGYVYTQQAVSAATGLSLEELAQREVFKPLGMTKSHFFFSETDDIAIARPHDYAGTTQDKRPPFNNAAASLHSDAGDYARFMLAVMNGEGLSKQGHKEMISAQVATPIRNDWKNEGISLSDTLSWSLGWGRRDAATGPTLWHWGDNGTYRAFVAMDPKRQNGLVYFANSSTGLALADDLFGLIGMDVADLTDWIEEPQAEDPGYQLWRKGVIAEAEKDYKTTIKFFRAALAAAPEKNKKLQGIIDWYAEFAPALEVAPSLLTADDAAPFTGQFGPRRIWFMDGKLMYQRGKGGKFALIPAGSNRFLLTGFTGFHLDFDFGADGTAVLVRGHYLDGETDEFKRGEEATD